MDPPPEAATPAGRDSLLRASLDTTRSRIHVRPIDPSETTLNLALGKALSKTLADRGNRAQHQW